MVGVGALPAGLTIRREATARTSTNSVLEAVDALAALALKRVFDLRRYTLLPPRPTSSNLRLRSVALSRPSSLDSLRIKPVSENVEPVSPPRLDKFRGRRIFRVERVSPNWLGRSPFSASLSGYSEALTRQAAEVTGSIPRSENP